MRLAEKVTLVTLLGVLIVFGLSYWADNQPTSPNIVQINHTGDSLRIARAKLDSATAEHEKERQASSVAQRALLERERRSRLLADAERRSADSLANLAQATDSTMSAWRMAYDERTKEATALREDVAAKSARIDSLAADTLRLATDLWAARQYAAGVDAFNTRLRVELQHATECRIIGKLRCPSRKETAVVVALATFIASH